jgi:inosine-uridine nucleoside N-ribohydrolase
MATTHDQPQLPPTLFTPSPTESHREILRILSEHPSDTITIIAIGPLTNLALAASESPTTLLRAKAVLVMGGAIFCPGNITPVGEFNALADAYAAARLFALTSQDPASTMPPAPPPTVSVDGHVTSPSRSLPPYPARHILGDRRLNLILFPLDLTTSHTLRREEFVAKTEDLIKNGSPLAEWMTAFLNSTFQTVETLQEGHEKNGKGTFTSLHDPACVWYAMSQDDETEELSSSSSSSSTKESQTPSPPQNPKWTITPPEDIRIETQGQWTRGMCVIDRRDRKKLEDDHSEEGSVVQTDHGGWLKRGKGNRVRRCVGTPGERVLAKVMLERIFGG